MRLYHAIGAVVKTHTHHCTGQTPHFHWFREFPFPYLMARNTPGLGERAGERMIRGRMGGMRVIVWTLLWILQAPLVNSQFGHAWDRDYGGREGYTEYGSKSL